MKVEITLNLAHELLGFIRAGNITRLIWELENAIANAEESQHWPKVGERWVSRFDVGAEYVVRVLHVGEHAVQIEYADGELAEHSHEALTKGYRLVRDGEVIPPTTDTPEQIGARITAVQSIAHTVRAFPAEQRDSVLNAAVACIEGLKRADPKNPE